MNLKNENQRFIEYALQIRKVIIGCALRFNVVFHMNCFCRLDQLLIKNNHVENYGVYKL